MCMDGCKNGFMEGYTTFVIMKNNLHLFLECSAGYIGPNCSFSCRYPSYGQDCQLHCYCKKSDCHSVTGCKGSCL